ncbi:molybdate ABC transporter substrate-binding protein [Luteipulveratus flavus]|uniref:Molybdate ABC transporter substrate-binding protein n=1 Tax=Luteipulveratus flavus TaxID=3031728 RepID=A0ABT6C1Z2_9MICO|nr:molybdate ABC transporter substrate-binding protein [Luteipulveratus sp. YIM 133296]MDF8262748.1 molybdate ABC transporter substrate-binding protein [Luteipulveratus sp. YIM 133296]
MSALRSGTAVLTATALATTLAGCGGDEQPARSKVVTVLAAASLTEAFTDLKKQVEDAHPDVEVRVSFAASSTIVQQVNNHADADVVALADEKAGKTLKPDVLGSAAPRLFATNRLMIATPADNPAHVTGLDSLTSSSVDTVLCAPQVPCGRAAKSVLAKGHVTPHVVSYEQDVKATLAKVRLGEADAAIVYVTDVTAAGTSVRGVALKPDQNVTTRLPIYALNDDEGTRAFVDAVTSSTGRKVLTTRGFGAP